MSVDLPGLKPRTKSEQIQFKIRCYFDAENAPSVEEINGLLNQKQLAVNAIFSFGRFLDALPIRASKGLTDRWGRCWRPEVPTRMKT